MPSNGIVDLQPVIERLMAKYDAEKKRAEEIDAMYLALGIRTHDWTKPVKVWK